MTKLLIGIMLLYLKNILLIRFKHINKKLDWITNLEEEITYNQEYHGYLEKRVSNTRLEGYDLIRSRCNI
jgi:hypothetical protein